MVVINYPVIYTAFVFIKLSKKYHYPADLYVMFADHPKTFHVIISDSGS